MSENNAPRIVIVTASAIGANPRVVKEADALQEAGFRVTVIALRTTDHVEPRDQAIARRAAWTLVRLDFRSRLRRAPMRMLQIVCRTTAKVSKMEKISQRALSIYTVALRRAANAIPAELYIAHYPAALHAAAAAARHHGARYAYDAEDYHHGEWPETSAFDLDRELVKHTENRDLPGAAYITASAAMISAACAELYRIPAPEVVLNVFPLCDAPARAVERGTAAPGPSLYWFSQTIGPDRGLECAVRAISMATTRPHLYLRGTPASGYPAALQRLASSHGAADRLHILPPAPPDEMVRLAAQYDLGLVAETGHVRNRDICLTNKLFTYLLAGVPPLMSNTSAHRAFAAETGLEQLCTTVDDPQALAARLDQILGHPEQLAAMRRRAWQLGQQRYNWEQEKHKVVRLVQRALNVPDQTVSALQSKSI